jgi:toxin ParE1/3/4
MSEVILSELAEEDLAEIWAFVAQDDSKAADRIIDQIYETCHLLAKSPKAGRLRPELDRSIRSLAVGNYLIFIANARRVSKLPGCCMGVATSHQPSILEQVKSQRRLQ